LTRFRTGSLYKGIQTPLQFIHGNSPTDIDRIKQRDPHERQSREATEDVFTSLRLIPERRRKDEKLLAMIVEPERIIICLVPSVDEDGPVQVHRGRRV
jgi:hypothetical protein